MVDIFIVGEDSVTLAILRRLIKDYAPDLTIAREGPVRGSQLKQKATNYNKLAHSIPVVLLEDLDTEDCAPIARKKLLNGEEQSPDFIINIAVDEAEAWLYADREGLSEYLGVPIDSIPVSTLQRMGGPHQRLEVGTEIKTSLHLTTSLILKSSSVILKEQILSTDGHCKGKEYNSAIIPFIETAWNPERARMRSYSLDGSINRIVRLNKLKEEKLDILAV